MEASRKKNHPGLAVVALYHPCQPVNFMMTHKCPCCGKDHQERLEGTGVFATKEEAMMVACLKEFPMPVAHALVYAIARSHGLPENTGGYGLDPTDLQFLRRKQPNVQSLSE